ncbi:hypothetical protein Pcinc_020389 [Petrolisthes cinctipes]|uniref:Uncharacterized protein n=1 Tax=Petrolisthes cinctipes TaxID=88211 RepID=A0AAE1FIE8_PETCI|nr:hypothetical protein Pcinc_020389 [Petrolisthes cinctipes]
MRESHCLMFLGPLSTHTQYKVNIVLQFAVKDTRESERERRMKNERRQEQVSGTVTTKMQTGNRAGVCLRLMELVSGVGGCKCRDVEIKARFER